MQKLPKGTLKNIKLGELKELFKEQKELGVVNFKEYCRQQIFDVLEKQQDIVEQKLGTKLYNELSLTNKNFDKIQFNLEQNKGYIDFLKSYRNNFSYKWIDKLRKWTNNDSKNLKKFSKNSFFTTMLKWQDIYIIDFIFNISKTYEDVSNLLETNTSILSIKKDIFVHISKFCNSYNDFFYFIDSYYFNLFLDSNSFSAKYIGKLTFYKIGNLQKIPKNTLLKFLSRKVDIEKQKIILKYFNIDTIDKLINFLNIPNIEEIFYGKYYDIKVLKFFMKRYDNNTFLLFLKKHHNIIRSAKIEVLEYLWNIANKEEILNFISSVTISKFLSKTNPDNIILLNFLGIDNKNKLQNSLKKNTIISNILYTIPSKNLKVILSLTKNKVDFIKFFHNYTIFTFLSDIKTDILIYFVDLFKIQNLEDFINIVSSYNIYHNIKNISILQVEYLKKLFDEDTQKKIIKSITYEELRKLEYIDYVDIQKIIDHPKGIEFGFFVETIKLGANFFDKGIFKINYENFTEFMDDNEVFPIEQDSFKNIGTKKWYNKNPEFKYFLKNNFSEQFLKDYFLHNLEDYSVLKEFYKNKIEKNRKNQFILHRLGDYIDRSIYNYETSGNNYKRTNFILRKFFKYIIHYRKKSFYSFFNIFFIQKEFNLGININKFKTLKDYLQDGEFQKEKLQSDYEKLLDILNVKNKEKKLKQLENAIKTKNYDTIEKIIMEAQYDYFEYMYHRKFKIKIKSDLRSFLNGEKIEDEKIDNPLFIEAYKMYMGTTTNKQILGELLTKYLKGEEGLYQYNTEKNKNWLKNNLSEQQQEIWLSRNEKIYEVEENKQESNANIEQEIKDKFEISKRKIEEINKLGFEFKTDFDDVWKLVSYYNKNIKKQEDEIRKKNTSLYEDLKLQIDRLKELKRENNGNKRKIEKIKIYRETNPLRSLMMGNWVQGSCLSFYSSIGNYWSAISNTIDVNKGVYYIEDGNGVLLARVLVAIDENNRLMRFKMYFAKNTDVDLNKYFNKYYLDLAKQIQLEINGEQDNLLEIESEDWYPDGTVEV